MLMWVMPIDATLSVIDLSTIQLDTRYSTSCLGSRVYSYEVSCGYKQSMRLSSPGLLKLPSVLCAEIEPEADIVCTR
jgi:hypothetical protein